MIINRKIEEIIKEGKVFSKGKIKVFYQLAKEEKPLIFFSMPKKVFNAVKRNYFKRVVRDILRKEPIPYHLLIKIYSGSLSFQDISLFFKDFKEFILYEDDINRPN